jgi:hypothetical protein
MTHNNNIGKFECQIGLGPQNLQIPHPDDQRKLEERLINMSNGDHDEGGLKFCNILKWSAWVV